MIDRLLGLLSLLQARPRWSAPELAERFGVTARTIRRDVERLRQLGYPIETANGSAGGYHLGSGGSAMPPLMLDRDEAIAVAVCLRSAAAGSIAGGGESTARALGKLEPLLPPAVARHVGAIGSVTSTLEEAVDPISSDVLLTVTRACRDGERLRVSYRDRDGRASERTLDPFRVVSTARRWYLVAHDRDRAGWRTLRIDRMVSVEPTGHLAELVDPPDAVDFVQRAITTAPYEHQVRVELLAPIGEVQALVPATTAVLEATADDTTIMTTGGNDPALIAFHLLRLGLEFRIRDGETLRQELERWMARICSSLGDVEARPAERAPASWTPMGSGGADPSA